MSYQNICQMNWTSGKNNTHKTDYRYKNTNAEGVLLLVVYHCDVYMQRQICWGWGRGCALAWMLSPFSEPCPGGSSFFFKSPKLVRIHPLPSPPGSVALPLHSLPPLFTAVIVSGGPGGETRGNSRATIARFSQTLGGVGLIQRQWQQQASLCPIPNPPGFSTAAWEQA